MTAWYVSQRTVIAAILWTAVLPAGCGSESSSPGTSKETGAAPAAVQSSGNESSPGHGLLVDVTAEAGITFIHDPYVRGGYLFPEITGAGCAFIDYDGDGWLDIYLIQSGRDLKDPDAPAKPNRLYRNNRDGTFTDVTEASGAGDTGYGQGVAIGDYTNNGYMDIYIQNVGPDVLLRNNGDGTFTDVTREAGIDNPEWAIGGGFLDIENNGWLDIYVSNYVDWDVDRDINCTRPNTNETDYCGPLSYRAIPDKLYRNNGDGTFTDVTREAGLTARFGPGMSAICADFDDDGFIDIYVGNDSAPNQLWQNLGNGRFEDVAGIRGCAVNAMGAQEASMGVNAEDFDNDGRLDLFMCHYYDETSTVYFNHGHYFSDASNQTGLGRLSYKHTGFGACVLDLFNDATRYIYVGNGAVRIPPGEPPDPANPMAEYDQVIRWSAADRRFTDISSELGPVMKTLHVSRGVAVGDFDNDGDLDILISPNNGPAMLLRNDAGNGNNWFMVRCLDRTGTRDAIGAKVYITAGGATRRRDVIINYSYASSSDPRVHFGMGDLQTVEQLRVRWPDGVEKTWENLPVNQVFEARRTPGNAAARR